MSLLEKPEAVTVGDFADGPDVMLWNPAVTTKYWRRWVNRAFFTRLFSTRSVAGLLTLALVLGGGAAETLGGALAVGGAIALLLSGLCDAGITAACLATDHQHGRRCALERSPGEFFLRSDDFLDLGPAAHRTAGLLIDLTGELHATASRDWIDPELPGRAHEAVWDALTRLIRTAPARRHAARLVAMPGEADLATTTATAIAEFDTLLSELLFHLQGCVTLTREWEAKLRHAELVEHTSAVEAELRAASIGLIVEVAEELPRVVFAYVTAARDLTGAGRFPWELPATEPVP
ncbi:hypothetical protein DMA12_35255 [Amycolatopsis balhimycina DSM 5908]|uniref:Uncharacterized protein n=1 Tax=Amycolatopsis balhimycina DSM 5908 TaxID=1081091 RepID=A0A428W445_AMYBA|nr:hypothetical protein [Amycolatopsis balhimycina]RSM37862.1 hypothetical protein DMA12_35255 [Amycolatopsis balhimycina DSM 5908]